MEDLWRPGRGEVMGEGGREKGWCGWSGGGQRSEVTVLKAGSAEV